MKREASGTILGLTTTNNDKGEEELPRDIRTPAHLCNRVSLTAAFWEAGTRNTTAGMVGYDRFWMGKRVMACGISLALKLGVLPVL